MTRIVELIPDTWSLIDAGDVDTEVTRIVLSGREFHAREAPVIGLTWSVNDELTSVYRRI